MDFATTVRAAVLTGLSAATNTVVAATDSVLTAIGKLQAQITGHKGDTSNPHSVTKSQIGLGSVDNTADANKPISTATQTALDAVKSTADAANNKITMDNGNFSLMVYATDSNNDVLSRVLELGRGMHTLYAQLGTTNNPTDRAVRGIYHQGGAGQYAWLQLFDDYGNIFTNYVTDTGWRGWKRFYSDADTVSIKNGGTGATTAAAARTALGVLAIEEGTWTPTVKTIKAFEDGGEVYRFPPHAKAYINSEAGRTELEAEVSEPYLSAVLAVWGDAPTVEDAPVTFAEGAEYMDDGNAEV